MSAWLLSYMIYDEILGIHEACQLLGLMAAAISCFLTSYVFGRYLFGAWKLLETKANAGMFRVEIELDYVCNEGAYGCCYTGSYPWEFIPTLGY